ncbi:LuxR C-terminal-related transcriptional regulator [Micromonospora sp. NPDC023737]|uniref:helix-turn-helix transcriptional regulator n=1 Tax=unclassified Micromonospora TaxID=2617518 RepID=UPI0033CADCE3
MDEPTTWWSGAGLPPAAGQVLEHLVAHPESTPAEIAEALGLPSRGVALALRTLSDELLAVRVSLSPARWSANPPRAAIESLLARRSAQLANVRLQAERLHEVYTETVDRRFIRDQFEVLDSPQRLNARYEHHLRSAQREVLHLVMPPYVAPTEQLPERMGAQGEAMARGVRFRSVYDSGSFDDELSLRTAREGGNLGGQIRLSNGLPMKMVMFDDTAAIMSLKPDDPAAGSLLVYARPLLRVLRVLFEELWEHGQPWSEAGPVAPPDPDLRPAPDPRMLQVLRFMALGMKDDAIARALGLSRRTVQQTVSDVGALLGARTRFQIALRAQQRGWLDDVPDDLGQVEHRADQFADMIGG